MEIGIFSRTYEHMTLDAIFAQMVQAGIHHTQFNLSSAGMDTLPETMDEEKLQNVLELARKYAITMDAVSGTFNMIDPDENARERGCRQFETQCRIAKFLHIPIVTLCTGSKNPHSKWAWHDDNRTQKAWDDLMRSTERVLRSAEDNGIILGVETEASNIICDPETARRYLDTVGSSGIKIIMDGANLFHKEQVARMDQVLDDAFALLGKDIVLAHAKDLSLQENIAFVAAGEGELDFPHYISLLKKYHYTGALILHGLSAEQIGKSVAFLKRAMA